MHPEANYRQQRVHLTPRPPRLLTLARLIRFVIAVFFFLLLFGGGVAFPSETGKKKMKKKKQRGRGRLSSHWNTFHMHENYIRDGAIFESF